MKITHHPSPESLMSCSAGSMPEAFAAVMASHIAMCPHCRHELAMLHEVGAALFEGLSPTPVMRKVPVLALRGLEAEVCEQAVGEKMGDVPAPLVNAVGRSLDTVAWRWVAPGVWQHRIALSHEEKGTLRLLKVAAGKALPEHGHSGSELTIVLRGSFREGGERYVVGDVADVGASVEHAPVADPDEGCICLIATFGKVTFKGLIARLLQPLTGF
jgi:putative transcriptional regulator